MSADRPTSELLPARHDAITAVLSCWFTAGLFLDAWAHNNVPRLETFFTPWHAVSTPASRPPPPGWSGLFGDS